MVLTRTSVLTFHFYLPGTKLRCASTSAGVGYRILPVKLRSWPMFVRINDPAPRPNSLLELGITSASNPIVSLNEFTYSKGTEIYGEKEPAEYVYQVKAGAVRSYKLLCDGRRQISAFHLAGDIFGLVIGGVHRFTAEAIVDTTVSLIKRQSLEIVAESDAIVARNLLNMTTSNLKGAAGIELRQQHTGFSFYTEAFRDGRRQQRRTRWGG